MFRCHGHWFTMGIICTKFRLLAVLTVQTKCGMGISLSCQFNVCFLYNDWSFHFVFRRILVVPALVRAHSGLNEIPNQICVSITHENKEKTLKYHYATWNIMRDSGLTTFYHILTKLQFLRNLHTTPLKKQSLRNKLVCNWWCFELGN